ncbi:MAG: prepilin peptidase [Sphingomonadaceae bacterium]
MPVALIAAGGALLGAIIGSFVATLIIRWPAGKSVASGRSCCDHCGAPIAIADLVPLVSFAMLRGRSRCCGQSINARHVWTEVACALIGGIALAIAPGWEGIAGALFGWILLALAVLDADHFWLPDALTLPLGVVGLAIGALGIDVPLIDRVIGAVAGYGVLQLVRLGYRFTRKQEGMGGGDPKLLGAIGAWLGWQWLPMVVLSASVAGLLWLLFKASRGGQVTAADRLPFGGLMAGAAFCAWLLATAFQFRIETL